MNDVAARASRTPSAKTGATTMIPGPRTPLTCRLMRSCSSTDAGTLGPTACAQRNTSSSIATG
jgi:hypothetical protein